MKLQESFGDRLKQNEPLNLHTNYRIGGPADWYLEVKTKEEVQAAVRGAAEDGLPIFVLGGGSNILVSDQGIRGLVLVMNMRKIQIKETRVMADAGAVTAGVAKASAEAGLTGFEWAIGIPGTIGGAVRGNAGCFGGEMKDVVKKVEAVDMRTGETISFMIKDVRFGYRESRFKHEPLVVIGVILSLSKDDRSTCLATVSDFLGRRKEKQPLEYSSAGCIFKNFEFKVESEISEKLRPLAPTDFLQTKRIPAGWLIDRVDLKGKRVGDAMISEKHGNFFVNIGNATAEEVVQLISIAKMEVRDTFGVQLTEEIQYVGF